MTYRAPVADIAFALKHGAGLRNTLANGGELSAGDVDAIVVTTAPEPVLRRRAFERPGMSEEKYARLTAAQHPLAEKLAHAHYVIDTSRGLDYAEAQVRAIIAAQGRASSPS